MPSPNHGWLSGVDPLTFDPSNYIYTTNGFALFLTQVSIIIILCQILGRAFQRIGQPAVVGELLAGILLGPTAFGNIPGFTETIIPPNALGLLKLMATIGLSLFLFLVGLETDTDLMARYWSKVLLITLPGMAIPFAVSVGIARLIWQVETDQSVQFTTFFLFVGTVMAVTSLSVLSRIMAEMGILSTTLGAITIAAGVCNDLIGYMLLALGSALGTGGKQIDALWQLLAAAGYILLLWFGFRPVMMRLIRSSEFNMEIGAKDRVPEHLLVIALVGALVSAFFTDSVGVHPIVGAFAFGVCCPHGNFAVQVTESIETLVMMVLLPLYFVTSGISTDFKLLDNGATWGLIFLLIVGIFVSKFGATAASARIAGFPWRQSMCVASLMQSKGIIEIIILNVALQLEVVSRRVFAMLVICFLCTTISVRPLSRYVYFSTLQNDEQGDAGEKAARSGAAADGGERSADHDEKNASTSNDFPVTVAITSVNPAIQALMSLIDLFGRNGNGTAAPTDASSDKTVSIGHIALDMIRLLPIEYTTSSIMQLIYYTDDRRRDTMLESLKTVQVLHAVPTSAALAAERALLKETHHQSMPITATLAQTDLALPHDTFAVGRDDLTKVIAKQHAKVQQRLRVPPSAVGESELGSGLAIVCWESSSSLGKGLSWLGAVAAASGQQGQQQQQQHAAQQYQDDEDARETFWQVDSDAQALPARFYRDLRNKCATGVLVDRDILDQHQRQASATGRGGMHGAASAAEAYRQRLEAEGKLGLARAEGRRRILVPFLGGADDRAAVELLQRIVASSEGGVDGVVVALSSSRQALSSLPFSGAAEASGVDHEQPQLQQLRTPTTAAAMAAEDENQESINLQTVYQAEAARVDARFLFDQQTTLATVHERGGEETTPSSSASASGEAGVAAAAAPAASPDTPGEPRVKTVDGVTFLTLPSPSSVPAAGSDTNEPTTLRTLLSTLLPLVSNEEDMILIGRGKWGQRPKQVRAEVEAMHSSSLSPSTSTSMSRSPTSVALTTTTTTTTLNESTRSEIRALGRTLGAATEGFLLGGLRANLLVVQAIKR